MKRIRVLHTLCRVNSGGVEQRRILLAQGLNPEKYEHTLVCQEATGSIPCVLRDAGWLIHEIGLTQSILNPVWHARAYEIAKAFQPDIVHGAVYEGEALACSIGLRMPHVKVVMEETSDPVNRRWTGNALMRAMSLRADACVGVSPNVTTYLRETLRIPQRKIHLVMNAVSQAPAPSSARLVELRKNFEIKEDEMIIGTVGRVVDSHKRFSDIIRALLNIRSVYPKARLLIVGDGPDRVMLACLVKELQLEDAVIFCGYQASPRDFYHLMDIFVLASAREAFGLVLVEAMLAKLPVVATRVGGVPGVVNEDDTGYLVEPFQPEELANAILQLAGDQAKRHSMGQRGRERALKYFSSERYVNDVDALYQHLLTERKVI